MSRRRLSATRNAFQSYVRRRGNTDQGQGKFSNPRQDRSALKVITVQRKRSLGKSRTMFTRVRSAPPIPHSWSMRKSTRARPSKRESEEGVEDMTDALGNIDISSRTLGVLPAIPT